MDRQVSYSVANFAAKFCNELGTNKTSICSPLSAEIVLALLALGCKNQSRAELLKALDIADDEGLRSSYGFLTKTLEAIKGATLNVANKVYLKKGGQLKPGIEKDAKKVFRSSLEQLDFSDKEGAANTINNWVAEQTNDKITNIVSPDTMTENTRMVLVNAIYFQGLWDNPFYKSRTRNSPFRVNEKTTISVPMMSVTETDFDYGASPELKAKMLRMWYQGGEASMVIVLPDEVEGLKSVLHKLASGHNIMTDIETMECVELDVMIPKFKVETTINLKQLLPKLGIKSIFDQKTADIDMLKSNEALFVSDAIQKALIIVDENGTEAAACTVLMQERYRCMRPRSQYFIANNPFVFLLIVRQTPIFIGIYEGSEYAQTCVNETEITPHTFKKCDYVNYCASYPEVFDADRPFLYLLIAQELPLFIGVYQGSEYA